MTISDVVFKLWSQGDLTRAEELLSGNIPHLSDPSHRAYTLAHRALVHARLKQWEAAADDAKKVIFWSSCPAPC